MLAEIITILCLPDGNWLICLADVSGYGASAAMGAAILKALVLNAIETRSAPEAILHAANRCFFSIFPSGYFATMFLGHWCLATGRLEYVNAGHPAAVVCAAAGLMAELTAGGFPVGIQCDAIWKTGSVALRPGDVFIVFSDGITEAADSAGELFGTGRLARCLPSGTNISTDAIVTMIDNAVVRHVAGRPFQDDLTVLVFRVDLVPNALDSKSHYPE